MLLAHLLGDGSFVKRQPIRYASIDEANLAAVADGRRQPVRHHRRARRVRRRPRDHAAAAGAVPPDPRQAEPDRGLARRGWACSACAATRSSCPTGCSRCRRSRSACSCGTSGRPTARSARREEPARARLLRLDQPAAGRRPRPAAAPVQRVHPDQAGRARPATGTAGTCTSTAPRTSCGSATRSASTAPAARTATALARAAARRQGEHEPRHRSRRGLGAGSRDVLAEKQMTHREFAAAMEHPVLRLDDVEARPEPAPAGQGRGGARRRRPRGPGDQRRLLGRGRVDRAASASSRSTTRP